MSQPLSILLVGAGGYGRYYFRYLASHLDDGGFRIAGIVDPYVDKAENIDRIREIGIPVFDDMGEFFDRESADLTVVSTPIHLHSQHTCSALSGASHVLCEKPLCLTLEDAREIVAARDRSERWVGIGYQWSYSRAIQGLKNDIMSGALGRPLRFRTSVLWPRKQSYYSRNGWAGRKRDSEGRWVLDNPVSNATAHFIHNAFYVLGARRESSVVPVEIQAEVYRAYDIDTFDTATLRMFTADGVEIVYIVSHVTPRSRGPVFAYEFENGTVEISGEASDLVFRAKDGTEKNYGAPQSDNLRKIEEAIRAARGETTICCPPEAAYPQVVCVNGVEKSMSDAIPFPKDLIRTAPGRRPDDSQAWVEGLAETLEQCFESGKLPSELGAAWSVAGGVVDLRDMASI
ncbi:Gfo/Idh/MocA family oxidoreductase [Candidatus Sumerlaeota bacterium]|nr:Gfo/Idh/MocA family oxidoreductase [Candidatus Sumerlaeota bacterium]